MRIKLSVCAVFFCLFATVNVSAGDTNITGSMSTGFVSEYDALIGATLSKSPISVNTLELDYKDFWAEVWNATSLGGRKYGTTYGDEWDLWGGWSHTFGPVKLSLDGSYFALAQLDKTSDDMWVTDQQISFPKVPFVQPYLQSRYFGAIGNAWKPGWFVFSGLRKSISLGHGCANRLYSLNLEASAAYSASALHDFTGFVYERCTACVDIPLSKHTTLSPSLMYQLPASGERNNPNGFTDKNQFIYGLNFRWDF